MTNPAPDNSNGSHGPATEEQAVLAAEQTAITLLNASDDMALLLDADRRVLVMNERLLKVLGKTQAEVIGRSIYEVAPQPWSRDREDELDAVVETGGSVRTEVDMMDHTVELRAYPVFDETGCLRRFAVFLRDVTKYRRTRRDLLQAEMLRLELQKDRDLFKRQAQLISFVSHELRTPLTAIQGSVDLLDTYGDQLDAERRQTHVGRIKEQVEVMKTMLTDLLTMRSLDSGTLKINPQPVELVAHCGALVAATAEHAATEQHFHLNASELPGPVQLDPDFLDHILNNLLSNAVKYTPPNGDITLSLEHSTDAADGSHWLLLHVQDTGIGIPQAAHARLFEPFYRAENARRHPGTGLGLAIARTYTEAHGGTLTCKSVEGQGTTFTVRLPYRPA